MSDGSSLNALFAPRNVAIVGASSSAAAIGGRPLHYAKMAGFAGRLFPVNPNRDTVQGIKAYPDIAAIPGTVDLAIIALTAGDVVQAVADCAEKGAKAAVIFSAGFAEVGAEGVAMQAELRALCRQTGIRALGPNCLGVYHAASRNIATFASCFQDGGMPSGPVALISQSGAYGSYLMLLAAQQGIGVGTWATTGNEMDVTVADLIAHLALDPAVKVIGCVAEGISDGQAFLRALETARATGKPVVLMKMGRTSGGAAAAQSHTASLAVDDVVFDAVVRQAGAYRVKTTQEMLDMLGALEVCGPLAGNRLGIVTMSGGVGVLMSDGACDAGLIVPSLPDATQAALKASNPLGAATNPVDVTGQAMKNPALVGQALDAMLGGDSVDAAAIFLMNWLESADMGAGLFAEIDRALAHGGASVTALVGTMPLEKARDYRARGVLVFADPDRAITTLGAMAQIGRTLEIAPASAPDLSAIPLASGAERDEVEAKALMAKLGVTLPQERSVETPAEAGRAAAEIGGRIALKIISADLPHKSDIGGVVLGLSGAEAVEQAAQAMIATVSDHRPDAQLDGLLVAQMIDDGTEMIVAAHRDPVFGPLVMVGFGGTMVEVLRDVAFRYGAIDAAEAKRMIAGLSGASLLDGVRGAPPRDIDALAEAIMLVSRFGVANDGRIAGIEINPLLVRPRGKGCVALDALVSQLASV